MLRSRYTFKKNFIYIFIVIVSTIISVCIMLLPFGIDNNKKINNKDVLIKNEVIKGDNYIDNKTISSSDVIKDDKVEQVNIGDNSVKDEKLKEDSERNSKSPSIEDKSTPISDSSSSGSNSNGITEDEPKKETSDNASPEETVAVLKVNKNSIMKNMSFFDKEKLLLIASKLSRSDYKKINDFLQNDVNGQGIVSSLKLSKEKLSKKDYSKLRVIAAKYINMEAVDNY